MIPDSWDDDDVEVQVEVEVEVEVPKDAQAPSLKDLCPLLNKKLLQLGKKYTNPVVRRSFEMRLFDDLMKAVVVWETKDNEDWFKLITILGLAVNSSTEKKETVKTMLLNFTELYKRPVAWTKPVFVDWQSVPSNYVPKINKNLKPALGRR
jgi:hypothetical protein